MVTAIKSQFLLDPSVTFLNHGSFGACPIPVFAAYQRWQLELERQPVEFMARRASGLLAEARSRLGEYLNAPADDLVYLTNSTTAINLIARSLNLQPGDEILTTDQEYPAMNQTWSFIEHKTGARYVTRPVTLPIESKEAFVEEFWAGVNRRTRVIFLSHIPYTLAVILPVEEICRRARQAGLVCIIDGAHAPGQIPLDMQAIGADVYFGACHKWLCAPKGASFLYVQPDAQKWVEPLIISRGWGNTAHTGDGPTPFIEHLEYQGTRDLSPFLSVPAAIQFQAENDWEMQRRRCHELASETRRRINEITGLASLCPDSPEWFRQLVSVRLPQVDPTELSQRLYGRHRIEVPLVQAGDGSLLMRVSFQAYNDRQDADALVRALEQELPQLVSAAGG